MYRYHCSRICRPKLWVGDISDLMPNKWQYKRNLEQYLMLSRYYKFQLFFYVSLSQISDHSRWYRRFTQKTCNCIEEFFHPFFFTNGLSYFPLSICSECFTFKRKGHNLQLLFGIQAYCLFYLICSYLTRVIFFYLVLFKWQCSNCQKRFTFF